MADSKSKRGYEDLIGPLYTKPDGHELGPHRVEGPRGGLVTPDPLGLGHGILRKGPNGQKRSQSHDKE